MTGFSINETFTSAQERIEAALAVAKKSDPAMQGYVIDQMVRALLGCPETYHGRFGTNDAYESWMRRP